LNHKLKLLWSNGHFCLLGIELSVNMDKIVKLNFERKLDEIIKVTNIWSKRKLTPIGKITLLYNFIQNGKQTDKVKRELLAQNYRNGGLKCLTLKELLML